MSVIINKLLEKTANQCYGIYKISVRRSPAIPHTTNSPEVYRQITTVCLGEASATPTGTDSHLPI